MPCQHVCRMDDDGAAGSITCKSFHDSVDVGRPVQGRHPADAIDMGM